jgi:hypothetical protein
MASPSSSGFSCELSQDTVIVVSVEPASTLVGVAGAIGREFKDTRTVSLY